MNIDSAAPVSDRCTHGGLRPVNPPKTGTRSRVCADS